MGTAKLNPGLTISAAIHLGVVRTGLQSDAPRSPVAIRTLFGVGRLSRIASSAENGVGNQLWASVSKDVKSGEYYEPAGIGGFVSE